MGEAQRGRGVCLDKKGPENPAKWPECWATWEAGTASVPGYQDGLEVLGR